MSMKDSLTKFKETVTAGLDQLISESDASAGGQGQDPKEEKLYTAAEVDAMIEEIGQEYDAKQVAETEGETGFKAFVQSKKVSKKDDQGEQPVDPIVEPQA